MSTFIYHNRKWYTNIFSDAFDIANALSQKLHELFALEKRLTRHIVQEIQISRRCVERRGVRRSRRHAHITERHSRRVSERVRVRARR